MRFPQLYLLLSLISTIHCISLDCSFGDGPFYSILGNPYECKVDNTTIIKYEYQVISSINGRHYGANYHDEVQMLWATATEFHHVPLGIGKFFPNIEGLWVKRSGLIRLEADKLKQFPHLRYVYLRYNKLEVLKPDVFVHNPKIEWLDFKENRLRFIDGEIFIRFPKLQNLNLRKNYCIDQHLHQHHGRFISTDVMLGLKYEIDMNCHRPWELYCSLYDMSHQGTSFYSCSSKGTAINHENITLARILHNKNATNLHHVHGLSVTNQHFTNFPVNLHEFLPNLMAIQIINSGLKELNFHDLKHYAELKSLWLPRNKIQVLENGVFENNFKLEKLSLYGNDLKVIESHVLIPLQFLKFVSFEKNPCIDFAASESGQFEDLKKIARLCSGVKRSKE